MSRLFSKTLLVVGALFAAISLVMSLVSGWNIHRGMSQEFRDMGHAVAGILADASVGPILDHNPVLLQSMIDQYLGIEGIAHILVADRDGTVIAHTFVPSVPPHIRELLSGTADARHDLASGPASTRAIDTASTIEVLAPVLGGMAGHVLIGMDRAIIRDQVLSVIAQQQGLMLLLFLCAIGVCWYLIRLISRPLNDLGAHARKVAAAEVGSIGKLSAEIEHLAGSSHDEIGELARSFMHMEAELDQSVRQLAVSIAEQERIRTELEVAREIQMRILPDPTHLGSLHPAVRIAARIETAEEVGGDFFDCFTLAAPLREGQTGAPGRRLFLAIGDVSGKGVPAALLMSMTCTLLRTRAARHTSAAGLLEEVNLTLSRDNETCMFVTVWCGFLDLTTRELTYASAGHNAALVRAASSEVRELQAPRGIVLGADANVRYRDAHVRLDPGDVLYLYTDGVTEATSVATELYSEGRLMGALRDSRCDSPEAVTRFVADTVRRFAAGAPQADDITMLAVQCV